MAQCIDLMESSFLEVAKDGEKLLDKYLMMNFFEPIYDKVQPFSDYLRMVFEEKKSCPIGSVVDDDKVWPYDLLRAQLFYPTKVDICQSHDPACRLGEVAAHRFVAKFRNAGKATAAYYSSIGGKKSMGKVSEREQKATIGKDASNSVSKSLHALTKDMQQKCGPKACTNRLAAVGRSIYNNDFGHATPLVTGRKPKAGKEVSCELGEFYKL